MVATRREFISLAAALGLSDALAPAAVFAQPAQIRVRENINIFSRDQGKVDALRLAVRTMKERSNARPDDPTGWNYWASSHGTPDSVPAALRNIYRQCDHSGDGYTALHFLSWHRAFLFFFESVLKQAARDAGSAAEFDLPYWDWYTQPVIPATFTRRTDPSGRPNSLWHGRTKTDLSADTLDRSAFTHTNMLPGPGTRRARTFSYVLEQDPHGAVHGLIGGDMGFVPTSARDPIFWLHHANVDRLWTAWMRSGSRVLPAANSQWAKKSWKFDAQGHWTEEAGPLLDSEASLHYRYDDETPPAATLAAASALVATATSRPRKVIEAPAAIVDFGQLQGIAPAAAPAEVTLSGTRESMKLGNATLAVDLRLAPPSAAQLNSLAAGQPADLKSANLVLEDVELGGAGRQGGFSFKIVASLPDASGAVHRATIGMLNTFSLSLSAHEPESQHGSVGKQTLKFPLADILNELGVTNPDVLAHGLRVTFEPAHSGEEAEQPDYVTIGAVKIEGSGSAEQ